MELELKHLAAYLPYGLKVEYSLPEWQQKQIDKITMLSISHSRVYIESYNFNGWIEKYKPILRPLSYLTKEIEVNGEKFIPRMKFYGTPLDYKITSNSYDVIQKLLEWHFDIFGLIDSGLAVDINSLNVD